MAMPFEPDLFKGEKIPVRIARKADGPRASDAATNRKYAAGEVRIVTEQARYPLPSIPAMLASGDYQLEPDFQRRRRWDDAKRSRLIESFIMNVPIPPIFLYEDRYSHYEVMDGLQRLTTIEDFYRDRFELSDLQEWPELNGRTYKKLPQQVKRGIDRRYLSSIILLQETAKTDVEAQRLKQLVFERINSGGVQLEPQETRNALFDGPLNRLCIELARDVHLCRMWGIPEPSEEELRDPDAIGQEVLENETYRKMEDVELVLRFFAYRQILDYDDRFSLREYLDHFVKHGNLFAKSLLKQYRELFTDTARFAYELFGDRAFWLWRRRAGREVLWYWLQRPTKVVYDPLMFALTAHLSKSGKILARKDAVVDDIKSFYEKDYQAFEGRATNRSNLIQRNELFLKFLSRYV